MTEKPAIYVIRHRTSGRVYVGSATNRKDLRSGAHTNGHLQATWNKYGEDAFDWVVLEFTSDLDAREQFWIDELDAFGDGFNLCPVARSSRGRTWSDQERAERMSRLHLRKVRCDQVDLVERARGMARALRKLTDDQAAEIRGRYGQQTMQLLADEYGVSLSTVHGIVHRKVYA